MADRDSVWSADETHGKEQQRQCQGGCRGLIGMGECRVWGKEGGDQGWG